MALNQPALDHSKHFEAGGYAVHGTGRESGKAYCILIMDVARDFNFAQYFAEITHKHATTNIFGCLHENTETNVNHAHIGWIASEKLRTNKGNTTRQFLATAAVGDWNKLRYQPCIRTHGGPRVRMGPFLAYIRNGEEHPGEILHKVHDWKNRFVKYFSEDGIEFDNLEWEEFAHYYLARNFYPDDIIMHAMESKYTKAGKLLSKRSKVTQMYNDRMEMLSGDEPMKNMASFDSVPAGFMAFLVRWWTQYRGRKTCFISGKAGIGKTQFIRAWYHSLTGKMAKICSLDEDLKTRLYGQLPVFDDFSVPDMPLSKCREWFISFLEIEGKRSWKQRYNNYTMEAGQPRIILTNRTADDFFRGQLEHAEVARRVMCYDLANAGNFSTYMADEPGPVGDDQKDEPDGEDF